MVRNEDLTSWEVIGRGGFGKIYRAKHNQWGVDVALKILHHSDGSTRALLNEAEMMQQASNPFVLRIMGVYEGIPPDCKSSIHAPLLGLVMEYMERGSLSGLQTMLNKPPPWPLAFRLAHQVALGMNFLHCLKPPLLHLDLKPSNVLLDMDLNARLTDFGLARLAHSVSRKSRGTDSDVGGTFSYMPPEAFSVSTYKPTPASDLYSYGILLWSIFTGQEPYAHAMSTLIRFRIPQGDRPDLQALRLEEEKGGAEITELMKKCWQQDVTLRPSFEECHPVTQRLYDLHKSEIKEAVYRVQKKLDDNIEECVTPACGLQKSPPQPLQASLPTERLPPQLQETGGGRSRHSSGGPVASMRKDAHHPSPAYTERQRASSLLGSSNQKTDRRISPRFLNSQFPFNRQNSTPVSPQGYGRASPMNIYMADMSFVQIGNNNHMYVNTTPKRQRHRNPTAPSRVHLPTSQEDHNKPHNF